MENATHKPKSDGFTIIKVFCTIGWVLIIVLYLALCLSKKSWIGKIVFPWNLDKMTDTEGFVANGLFALFSAMITVVVLHYQLSDITNYGISNRNSIKAVIGKWTIWIFYVESMMFFLLLLFFYCTNKIRLYFNTALFFLVVMVVAIALCFYGNSKECSKRALIQTAEKSYTDLYDDENIPIYHYLQLNTAMPMKYLIQGNEDIEERCSIMKNLLYMPAKNSFYKLDVFFQYEYYNLKVLFAFYAEKDKQEFYSIIYCCLNQKENKNKFDDYMYLTFLSAYYLLIMENKFDSWNENLKYIFGEIIEENLLMDAILLYLSSLQYLALIGKPMTDACDEMVFELVSPILKKSLEKQKEIGEYDDIEVIAREFSENKGFIFRCWIENTTQGKRANNVQSEIEDCLSKDSDVWAIKQIFNVFRKRKGETNDNQKMDI